MEMRENGDERENGGERVSWTAVEGQADTSCCEQRHLILGAPAAAIHLSSFLETFEECQAVDLMKVLNAAECGFIHSGGRLPCCCSVMKR